MPTLFTLSLITTLISLIMIIIVKSVAKTVGWSIALHISLLIPAGMIWAVISWGTSELFFKGMAVTTLPFTVYCAAFINYRSRRERKARARDGLLNHSDTAKQFPSLLPSLVAVFFSL